MSTNCNKLKNSPKEEQEETIKLGIPSPNHEIQSESQEKRGKSDRREKEDSTKINDGEENCEATISSRESDQSVPEEEEEEEEEEEGDGFRTPTSIAHKIPAIIQCPSPPRKTRPQYSRLKRRAPPEPCRRLRFVAADEVESILSPMIGDNVEEKRLKKARTTAGDES